MLSSCQPFIFPWPRLLLQGTVMFCKGWLPIPLSSPPPNKWWLPLLSQPPAQAISSIPSLVSSKGPVLCLRLLLRSEPQIILSFLLSSPRHNAAVPTPFYALPSSTPKNIMFFPKKNSPPALIFISIPFSALPWCFACSCRKTFTMEEISGGGEDHTGASIPPDSCSCSTNDQ